MALVAGMTVLALNAGSSSLKFLVSEGQQPLFTGVAQGFGQADSKLVIQNSRGSVIQMAPCDGLHAAAQKVLDFTRAQGRAPSVVGHRIVHGGPHVTSHCVIDGGVRQALEQASALAPLHNPPALDVLDLTRVTFPNVPQVACLDTAFHATLSEAAKRFPLPADVLGDGVRRYGFHGLSCESILAQLDPVPSRLVIAHLGGGASVTAVGAGQSVDTSMGLTPNGGVIMETRSGDLDPGLLIYLLRQGQTADTLEQLLNHRSGMAGVGGNGGDPRKLAGGSGKLALEMFALSIAKAIACMAIVLEGIDLVAFTGGIGEHDADIRQSVLDRLDWIGTVPARVIPAREEMVIVRHCLTLTHG